MKATLTYALSAVLSICLASVSHSAAKSVVLVHGAFADGSGWGPVADILEHAGYTVYVVQEPETSFEADVAATRLVLDRSGPCVLVGHSYGGMIISEIGAHPAVRSLVYVAAFEPEVGESAGALHGESYGRQLPSRNAERLEAFREKTSLQESRELCRIVSGHHVEVGFRCM
jgi:pimeloyl-ACP methyl ester carboxylesterase